MDQAELDSDLAHSIKQQMQISYSKAISQPNFQLRRALRIFLDELVKLRQIMDSKTYRVLNDAESMDCPESSFSPLQDSTANEWWVVFL